MGRVIEYFMTGFVCNRREGVRGSGGGRDGVRGGGREGNVRTLSPLRQRVSGELACGESVSAVDSGGALPHIV